MSAVIEARARAIPETRSAYIAGPLYDWAFFLLPPLASIVVGALLSEAAISRRVVSVFGMRLPLVPWAMGALIHAHLAAVFVRSHLDPAVFPRHPIRFVVVPIVVFFAMMISTWAAVIATIVVVFWDVYHSAAQTFGLSRIYDRNAGNDPHLGRRLDFVLNLLLYAGPIVGGATMLAHFSKFEVFEDVGAMFFSRIPALMSSNQRYLTWGLLIGGSGFVAYYVLAYARFAKQGYRVSLPKVFLLATTGLCSIWVWGWNPWGQAFLIMNLFHAVQYLALVWWTERGVLLQRLRLEKVRLGRPIAASLFLSVAMAYGLLAEGWSNESRALWSLGQSVALMHFFYDGFVWSVRRRQI